MSDNGEQPKTNVYLIRLYAHGKLVAEAPFIVHDKELAWEALKAHIATAVTQIGPQAIGAMFLALAGPPPNINEYTGLGLVLQEADKEEGHA